MSDVLKLEHTIKRLLLHWRDPKLLRILKKINNGRMRPDQARRWLKRLQPTIDKQEKCFNSLPPAPDQEQLGSMNIEIAELIENPGVRVGPHILQPGKHLMVCGSTGSGKSTVLRRIVDELNRINRNTLAIHNDSDI